MRQWAVTIWQNTPSPRAVRETQQCTSVDEFQEVGADETAWYEDGHGYDIVRLRRDLSLLFSHAFVHQYARTILYNKRPAHDLHTNIEKLGDDTLAIVVDREDALQGRQEVDIVVLRNKEYWNVTIATKSKISIRWNSFELHLIIL